MIKFLLGAAVLIFFLGVSVLVAYGMEKRPMLVLILIGSIVFIILSWAIGDLILE